MSTPLLRARLVPSGNVTRVRRVTRTVLRARGVVGLPGPEGPPAATPVVTSQIIAAAGPAAVQATDGLVAINKVAPSVTTLLLPSVAARADELPLKIVDWGGNGGDVTLTPHGAETVMGLASATLTSNGQGLGMAAAVTLYPSVELNGWYVAP